MPRTWLGLSAALLFVSAAPASAQDLDVLRDKFTFNWHSDPGRQKCVKVAGPLLANFKSAKYTCDLTVKTNSSSGAPIRTCTEVKGQREYLVFETMRACERERKEQESNGD
jgi:hypothetical protein